MVDQAQEILAPRGQRHVLPARYHHVVKIGVNDGKGLTFLIRRIEDVC